MKRYLSSPFFLIALIAFFLPFFAVTCAGGDQFGDLAGGLGGTEDELPQATEVTGLELVTGQAEEKLNESTGETAPDVPEVGPSPGLIPDVPTSGAAEDIDLGTPQILAIAGAAIALLGIFLSLIGGRAGGGIALALGVAGGVVMFLLKSEFAGAITRAVPGSESILVVENRIGFWIALGGFVAAAVTGLVRLVLPDRPAYVAPAGFGAPPAAPPGAPPPAPPPGPPAAPPTEPPSAPPPGL